MRSHLTSYLATGLTFLLLDFVWLALMKDVLYRPHLGELLADTFQPAPAVAFYALYAAGILFFAVSPALASGRWETALGSGALLGLIAYGTYDLTNQATLKGWPAIVTIIDTAWGATLTATAATVGYAVATWTATTGD